MVAFLRDPAPPHVAPDSLALGRAGVTGQSRARERDRGCPLAGSSPLNRLELDTPELAGKDR